MRNNVGIFTLVLGAVLLCAACGKEKATSQTSIALPAVDMETIPAGEFVRGSDATDTEGLQQRYGFAAPLFLDEHPKHAVTLPAFQIDTYEVTNAQYKAFVHATQRVPPQIWNEMGYVFTEDQLQKKEEAELRTLATDVFRLDMDTRTMSKDALLAAMIKQQQAFDNYPAGGMTWFDAYAFCAWRGARLPSEAEWEKAARGADGREYPWGNNWDPKIAGTGDDVGQDEGFSPVGSFPKSASPYGVHDMAGNVWEWVQDWYDAYPKSDYTSKDFGKKNKVIRGGSGGMGHYAISYFYRASTRQNAEPEMQSDDVGFRCAKDAAP